MESSVPPTRQTISTNGHLPAARDADFVVDYLHRLRFTRDVFNPANPTLAEAMGRGGQRRARVFVDAGVAAAWPDLQQRIEAYAKSHADVLHFARPMQIVPGGEAVKNDPAHVQAIVRGMHEAGLCRKSYAIAVGGGAVLDAVGFAAAMVHRGVRLIRLPTTTLAQDDAGVGVKNGVNAFGKKNFLGTFAPPWAVINDELFLTTLSDRDWRSGLSEAVKVALVKDAAFFDQIEATAPRLRTRDHEALLPIVRRSAELHLNHIVSGGDPFELHEARPLDFGHWAAHKLEQMSEFRIRHGEAVAIGIGIDAAYSALLGWLPPGDAERIRRCLMNLGFELANDQLREAHSLLDGLGEFREHLGGRLTISLLRGIGTADDAHEIDHALMTKAIIAASPS
jgi:3-dehydroquinate synthase